MATNNFKSFATGAGANVMAQSDWEALPALSSGFSSGKASSAQVNKAIRQASMMASMLGQFVNKAGLDALDDGNMNALLTNFQIALGTNLSLGTAAQKNIGTSTGQIPDMSAFAFLQSANGYQKFPGGTIIQWGTQTTAGISTTYSLPISFPNNFFAIVALPQTATSTCNGNPISNSQYNIASYVNQSAYGTIIKFIAIGN
ncbi:hypothetical protein [Pantoea sp. BAV 3049]|uniref:gp53-like domain-containing protein n=1 Tax=Pantoea sp. BAV 3049 TaxID=2654188 RepID=UPI00131B56EC|nr:hypothetical protein [Pantoea sp. BAV 3049]